MKPPQMHGILSTNVGIIGGFETSNDELAALRTLIREEVNAAIYASEQRIGERMEGGQRELRLDVARIEVQLSETLSVLNDASRVINDLRFSQHALETKVEENLLGLRRDMQRLNESVHTFSRHFIAIDRATSERITTHE